MSAAVTRYESTLREVLNALCPSPDTLAHKYGGETDAASLSREVFLTPFAGAWARRCRQT
ncbi:MAG: hypothetical protein ACLRNQ_22655 [Flavonifractor plautii]